MNTIEMIKLRKSVRKFHDKAIPEEAIREVLAAGMEAPSVKNSQAWKFYVISGKAKEKLADLMETGLSCFGDADQVRKLPFYGSVINSIKVIRTAPTVILVFNTGVNTLEGGSTPEARFMDCATMQTMGAVIQNMLLAATDLGLGSLWMCDVYFAYELICGWLQEDSQLAAGVALGYSDDRCSKAARHHLDDHTVFLGD